MTTLRACNCGEIPSAFTSLQAALDALRYGDTLELHNTGSHGADIFDTPGDFASFNLRDKGTPPTGTDADYIRVQPMDMTGIAPALSRYPHEDVRITTAMAARMPKVRTASKMGYPAIWVNEGAKYWHVEGLDITNSPVSGNIIRLIGNGEDYPKSITTFPDHVTFQRNWIHPREEQGQPLTRETLHRTAECAFFLEGTNITLRQNSIQGFVGKYADGSGFATCGHLMTTWADNVLLENNLIEAWTYAVFYGGGSRAIAKPEFTATVRNCTATSAEFSNVNGIVAGMPITVGVYPIVLGGEATYYWGTAFVKSVQGNVVEFVAPLCNSNNTGGNGNVCKPFDSANERQIPADGSPARWGGYIIQNVLVRRNIFAHRPEWIPLMDNQCGGKGYLEMKLGRNVTFDGNIFKGCTGPTVTTRNQSGADPWANLDNLTFSNNWWWNANAPLTAYLNDGGNLTYKTRGYKFINNLVVGEYADPNEFSGLRVTAVSFSGGEDAIVRNNTVLVGSSRNFMSFADKRSQMDRLVMENNIFRAAVNLAYGTGAGETAALMNECWPGATVRNNVLLFIDNKSTLDEIQQTWLTPFPNNFLVRSLVEMGFEQPSPSLDASGLYRLREDSPYAGKGTDGKDIGCDIDLLNEAVFGDSPPPLPPPTPDPPVPPIPEPPVPPPPTPEPPVPPPAGAVRVQGRALHGETSVVGVKVMVSGMETISRTGDGYWWFDTPVAIGSVVTGIKDGWTFAPVTVREGVPEQFYGLQGVPVAAPPPPVPEPPVPEPPTQPPCTITAPASINVRRNTTAIITVMLSDLTGPTTVKVVGSDGQVTVSPLIRTVSGTSASMQFNVKVKKQSRTITFQSPCGEVQVRVNVT